MPRAPVCMYSANRAFDSGESTPGQQRLLSPRSSSHRMHTHARACGCTGRVRADHSNACYPSRSTTATTPWSSLRQRYRKRRRVAKFPALEHAQCPTDGQLRRRRRRRSQLRRRLCRALSAHIDPLRAPPVTHPCRIQRRMAAAAAAAPSDEMKCVNAIRVFCADVVQKANSGHPGELGGWRRAAASSQ